jgi:LemA protein
MNYIYLVAAVVVVFLLIAEYNTLIAKKNQNDNSFAQIDVFLKKRHDLIPNLVATAQNYMKHERETLTQIADLRSRAASGSLSQADRTKVESDISAALGKIMVAVENYPDLKADKQFLLLQAALNEAEEQISAARRAFNASVTDYNNAVQMFPTKLVAALMGLQPRPVFAASAEDRAAPNVASGFKG